MVLRTNQQKAILLFLLPVDLFYSEFLWFQQKANPIKTISTSICIVGAGPGGATVALQLNRLGIECTVVDKATFPRDKVCGDGLSGKVITILEKIDPAIAGRFRAFSNKQPSWGVSFVSPGRYAMPIPYKTNYNKELDNPIGFVCKRFHFDNFLVDELKKAPGVQLIEGIGIDNYEKTGDGYRLSDAGGKLEINCSLLIVANGAHSVFTKKHAKFSYTAHEYSAGVRGYFSNVRNLHIDQFIELHFLSQCLPGYLWIFPLPGGEANVGLDMLSSDVSRKKINLRKLLIDTIATDPALKERFSEASLNGKVEGYGLPLAARERNISGENYMLVGDAGFMIDPLTGEGIGNAMYAGRIAALQAANCVNNKDYSAASLSAYDRELYRVLGPEFKLSKRLQKLAAYPRLFNWLMKRGSISRALQTLISGMLYDVKLRKQLASPRFYVRLLMQKFTNNGNRLL
jgi:geranylgeranyl reductase family protein